MSARVPTIVVHGGAGTTPADDVDEIRAALRAAVAAGWSRFAARGSALDAVEAAVRVLEDHPRFNAGRGAVLTAAGTIELDASIMEGDRLACGAVAVVSRIANPVSLARRVLDDGRHVLLVADGALDFARAHGIAECDPAWLVTERQLRRWRQRADPGLPAAGGTVGAVALDTRGTVAVATSTGGIVDQLRGRVGDSALIGCGTYADSTIGGVSCTGTGEAIIRTVLGRRALDFLKEAGDAEYAARVAVDVLVDEGRGEGGLILLDWRGRVGFAASTPFMPVAWQSPALSAPATSF
jgi:beta-aspartyl-peptidase (threonine type)